MFYFITTFLTVWYNVNVQTVIVTVSPLSLYKESGVFIHLFSSQPWEGGHFYPISQEWTWGLREVKWFSLLQSWNSSQIFWFYLHSFSFSPYGLLLEAGRQGIQDMPVKYLQINFWNRCSIHWSCLYPWVCLTNAEITQVNLLPPRAHTRPQGCHLLVGHPSPSTFHLLCNLQERILRVSLSQLSQPHHCWHMGQIILCLGKGVCSWSGL